MNIVFELKTQAPTAVCDAEKLIVARMPVKKPVLPKTVYSSTMLPLSETYRPSKNFRISLLRTLQICWMSAALWETSSRLCD